MMRQTSLEAYGEVRRDLARREQEVFDAFLSIGPATDFDVAALLGWSINRVTPRRLELFRCGRVFFCGFRVQDGYKRSLWGVSDVF